MVNLQSEFLTFHDNIKLSDENQELREKRNILLNKLKNNISNEAAPYVVFNQGSYAMGTGIKPSDGDYDIDVGLKFDIACDDYEDPVTIKKWVKDALDGHTKSVKIRRSCVTVTYQKDNEPIYHVDFACYAAKNDDGKLYIAKGKENSGDEYRVWETSDPQGLLDYLKSLFKDADDRTQFRRCVRYLKKWKNEKFLSGGSSVPTGIALTALVCKHFLPKYTTDIWSGKRKYDDFTALKECINGIQGAFSLIWDSNDNKYYHSISQNLPVEPYNDLFEKMSLKQQEEFYNKVVLMQSKLSAVEEKTKKSEACKILVDLFGDKFPVTAERSYVGTSESA